MGYIALLLAAILCGVAGIDVAEEYSHASVSDPDPHGTGDVLIDHPAWDYYGPALYSLAMVAVVPGAILIDRYLRRAGASLAAGASMVPVAGLWSYWAQPGGNVILVLSLLGIVLLLISREGSARLENLVTSGAIGVAALAAGLLMCVGLQDIYWFGIETEYIFDPATLEYIRTDVIDRDTQFINQGTDAVIASIASYCLVVLAALKRFAVLLVVPGVLAMLVGYIDLSKDVSMNHFGPSLLVLGVIIILASLSLPLLLHPYGRQ